jgi:hypothetical protein
MGFSQMIGGWCARRRWMENGLVAMARRLPRSRLLHACCHETAEQILQCDRAAVRVAFTSGKLYLSVPLDGEEGRQFYFYDDPDPRFTSLLSKLIEPGQTWLDANSGLGFFAMLIANAVGESGKVIVFESRTEMIERLQSSIVLDGATNVTLVPIAPGAPGIAGQVCLDDWLLEKKIQPDALRVTAASVDLFLGFGKTLKTGSVKYIVADLQDSVEATLKFLREMDFVPYAWKRQGLVESADLAAIPGGRFVMVHKSAADPTV